MASIYKRGHVWWMKKKVNGKWKSFSLDTKSKRDAQQYLRELDEKKDTGDSLTVDHLEERYLEWAPGHVSAQTVESRVRAMRRLRNLLRVDYLDEVDKARVEDYKRRVVAQGVSARTVNESVGALRSLWNRAIREGWHEGANPWLGAASLKETKKLPRWLNDDQVVQALAVAKAHSQDQHIFWALGVYAGLRKGECVEARWEWFNWRSRILQVTSAKHWTLKDHEERAIPLHSALAEILSEYREKEGYLIAPDKLPDTYRYRFEVRKGFATVVRELGLEWVTPHMLRHTFASRNAQAGTSLYKIAKWMGHSHTRVTERYGHLQPYDEDIERVR
jgi:integrase/recombinase XerD